jgi:hypothetical protein
MALRVFALDQSQMTLLSGKIVIGEVKKKSQSLTAPLSEIMNFFCCQCPPFIRCIKIMTAIINHVNLRKNSIIDQSTQSTSHLGFQRDMPIYFKVDQKTMHTKSQIIGIS